MPHADSRVRACEEWLAGHFAEPEPVARAVARSALPERTLKRRFKAATGVSLIGYVQNLRIEEAKRLLETGSAPVDAIAAEVGYENPGFFRSLFKRNTGLTPDAYRKLFKPVADALGGTGVATAAP
jgi:transcriptional regulator GlxA family with amidase domain